MKNYTFTEEELDSLIDNTEYAADNAIAFAASQRARKALKILKSKRWA